MLSWSKMFHLNPIYDWASQLHSIQILAADALLALIFLREL
jgi:hypothetical protein